MVYNAADAVDYSTMLGLTGAVASLCFGATHTLATLAWLSVGWLLIAFPLRHGCTLRWPLLLTDGCVLPRMLAYKLDNARPQLLVSAAVMCMEQAAISATPTWQHRLDEHREFLKTLFFAAFWGVTVIRVGLLGAHVWHRQRVFDFLAGSPWRKVLRKGTGVHWQLLHLSHAFVTGVLCHILAVAPLYVLITSMQHSVVLLPLRVAADCAVFAWFHVYDWNDWLYRDHWVSHHDAADFLFLHGPHHDALPVSLMAAHDVGMLEGFLRFSVGHPEGFMSPMVTAPLRGVQVLADMVFHQYVPGVAPYSQVIVYYGHHHAEHHFLRLHPLGSGFDRSPDGVPANTTEIDVRLAGYNPENKVWEWFCSEVVRLEGHSWW